MSATENRIQCEFINNPAAIERIVRTIRARGFKITQLQLNLENNQYNAMLAVVSERDILNLIEQLRKLVDVTQAKIISTWHTPYDVPYSQPNAALSATA